MKLAIMQPYFLPYIGYFQLIDAVDLFVIYDNIKYTKKGWINRNRLLREGADSLFSLPLKGDSDALDIRERYLSAGFDRKRLLNQFSAAYRKAPCFEEAFPVVERLVLNGADNLFDYLHFSLREICGYLGIKTEIRVSSTVPADHALRGEERVLSICRALGAKTYVNAIGGRELYFHDAFGAEGIELRFLQSGDIRYTQFGDGFVPWLSMVDVMMFNPREFIREGLLPDYRLIRADGE